MPELPEVEVMRMGLEKVLVDNTFLSIEVKNKKIISGNGTKRIPSAKKEKEFVSNVINKKIISVKRRAKNIIISFEDESIIIVHLKMTGQIIWYGGGEAAADKTENKHTHIIFTLKNGILHYNDVRQFGYVLYYKNTEEAVNQKHFSKLGLEPFDKNFTLKYFTENILKKNKSIKSTLLEQSIVVGCGNIYCDEICFASNVLPTRNCKTFNTKEMADIYNNIKIILRKAIKLGGSSVSDYKMVNGESGKYANLHQVYGRSNMPCYSCSNKLEKTIISGRATVFCNTCQK